MDFKSNTKIARFYWLSLGKSILFFVPIIGLFVAPVLTQAGVLSFITDLFSGQPVSAQSETIIEASSQNMPLPEPATNFDPIVKVGAEVVIAGGEALLPEVGPSITAPEEIDNSNGQISVYLVRSGDTLAGIAEMFDVSVNTILWANDITKGSALKTGQSLVILPISGVLHTVVKGDTLNNIAKKYNGDLDEIASFNDLSVADKLVVGDTIMIPNGQVSSSIRPSTVSSSKSGATKLIAGYSGPSYGDYYIKPFVGGVKTQSLHGYNGVDYAMPVGTPLYAAAQGIVIISKNSGWNGGYANYVVIQHSNNTQTVYGHMKNTVVSVGQSVTQGQLIGYSGNTGNSTGPHLHFEIRGAKNPF
jgi:LysM repeat protein